MKLFEKTGIEWRDEFQKLHAAHTKLLHENGALTALYNTLAAEKHNAEVAKTNKALAEDAAELFRAGLGRDVTRFAVVSGSDMKQYVADQLSRFEKELTKERDATRTAVSGANNALRQRDTELRDLQAQVTELKESLGGNVAAPENFKAPFLAARIDQVSKTNHQLNEEMAGLYRRIKQLEELLPGADAMRSTNQAVVQLLAHLGLEAVPTAPEEKEFKLKEKTTKETK